jgi:hypothetical protein
MRKEGRNRWPDKDEAPELYTHDLRALLTRLGVDPSGFDPRNSVAPALKMVLEWRRDCGYAIGKFPLKYASQFVDAAFGHDGVVEWLAARYRLTI